MLSIDYHVDAVGGTEFINMCDVQSSYGHITIAKKDCHKIIFVTSKGEYVFKVSPFGIVSAP